MPGTRKAIIIGGGPAGLVMALRLHQSTNIRCSIYELRPEPTTLGSAIGIMSNGMRLLDRLGVHDKLIARGSSRSNLVLHSMQGGIVGEQNLILSAKEETGYGYIRIKRMELQEVLIEAIDKAGIPIHYNKRFTSIDDGPDGVKVAFSDGTTDEADLLLGCDGIHSAVRTRHVDPSQAPEYSGMAGLGSIIPASTLPDLVSSQVRGMHATLTQGGMFAATTTTASDDEIVWFITKEVPMPESEDVRDGWEVRRKDEVAGFKTPLLELLKNAGGEWGDTMRQIVDRTSMVRFYPIYKLPLGGTWSKGRCLLIGDAAHAMPPHAGQGVSMAFEDVFLLARLLEDESRPLDRVFERYEQIRRPRVDEISVRATQNARVRKNSGPWGLWLKELGIWMFMCGARALGMGKWGSELKYLVYDIDAEEL